MDARFVGGPLDGRVFDHSPVNAVATIVSVKARPGVRLFLLVPPDGECDRILRGELRPEQAGGPLHPYEQVVLPGGGVEFRDAGDSFGDAVRTPGPGPSAAWAAACRENP